MKKRLLSAVLALAMALTLLPVSVFASYDSPAVADIQGDGTETVKFVSQRDTAHPQVGWYVTVTYDVPVPGSTTGATTKKTKDVFLDTAGGTNATGLSVGGKYYKADQLDPTPTYSNGKITNKTIYNYTCDASSGTFTKTGLKGNVIVIGGSVSIDAVNASSLTLDVYGGGTATITQTNTGSSTTKLSSVTVNNTQYLTQGKGTITLSSVMSELTSLTLKHVTVTDAVNLTKSTTSGAVHRIDFTDVTASSGVTLTGSYTNASGVVSSSAQNVIIRNSNVGAITVTGNGSQVTLDQMPASGSSAVSMTSVGGSFTFRGGGKIGALTITGSTTGDANGNDLTTAPAGVSIATGCTVASINTGGVTSEKAAGRNTVTINGTVSGAVNFRNAAVSVNGGSGNTGAITLESGMVTVSGNRATVGDVKLAHDATFTLSGTNCTVGSLTVGGADANPATVTFTVPNEPSNTLGSTTASVANYNKATINGGTWNVAVPAINLASTLVYQLQGTASGGPYTYYTSDQLGEAVLKQGQTTGSTLTKRGVSGSQTVTFKNGSITWGVLTVTGGTQIPMLPTQMNSVSTLKWSDGKSGDLSGLYNTPASGNVVLDAGGGGAVTGDVTKLTGVSVTNSNDIGGSITAKIVGNVITLSGAVESGQTNFTLNLETDAVEEDSTSATDPKAEKPVTIQVGVSFDPAAKTLTFNNPGTAGYALSNGVVVENTFQALRLANGTRYTLSGTGLNVRSYEINVKGIDTTNTYPTAANNLFITNDIEVVVNAPGYNVNDTTRQIVIDAVNGTGAGIDWANSPAVKQAINAALATITDTQVQSYIQAARQRAWNDNGIRGQALTATTATAYNAGVVWLVPYLQVTVTDYKPTTTTVANSSLSANLSLMWRVEVHPDSSYSGDVKIKDAPNVAKNGVFIAKTGTALTLNSDLRSSGETGGLVVKFKDYTDSGWHMHQGSYGYAADGTQFTMTHAVNGNLGAIVINKTAPLVARYTAAGGTVVGMYETLQNAVDDTTEGQHIVIDSAYTGSTTISMTGMPRTITIQANGKNVVVANASGGLVTENTTGSLYTLKLNRVTAAPGQNIVVASATGGTAIVNANPAKAGQTVTVTLTASTGYTPSGVTVTYGNNQSAVVSGSGNTYTFTMPSATTVTVTPTFKAGGNQANIVASTSYQGSATPITGTTDGKVQQGATVPVTVSPSSGYRTMGLTARGNNGTTAAVTRTGANSFNVTVPAGATTVTVTPSFDIDTGTPFTDVTSTHWATSYVSWAYRNKYVEGRGTYLYEPNGIMFRSEVAAMLWKAAGKPSAAGMRNPYTDVTPSHWAYEAIVWCANKGFADVSSGSFRPNSYATRAEVVSILYTKAGKPNVSANSGFADVSSRASYAKAVTWAKQQGLTNGYNGNANFAPTKNVSRAEMATFLYRAFAKSIV